MKNIGPSFGGELIAAGLGDGLSFSCCYCLDDGTFCEFTDADIQGRDSLTAEDQVKLDAVIAAHVCPTQTEMSCAIYYKKVNDLKAKKFAANAFEWPEASGHLWQTTEDKQAIVTSRALRAKSVIDGTGGVWSDGLLYYKDLANDEVPFLTPQEFLTFAVDYQDYLLGIATVADAHKKALVLIRDNTDLPEADRITAMEAYFNQDAQTGW